MDAFIGMEWAYKGWTIGAGAAFGLLDEQHTSFDIERGAGLLGYSPRDFIASSYGALYLAECRRRRKKPSHLVFSRKKLRNLAFSS